MTIDEARDKLPFWLDMAAQSHTYSKYDELCDEAYKILSHDEYEKIWKQWANDYVSCSDGYYRRK